jgi:hypothetical protein
LSEALQKQLTDYIAQTLELRYTVEIPNYQADIDEVHSALIKAQMTLSKIEKFLSNATRAKAATDRKVFALRMTFQEKWDTAILKVAQRPTLGEFATGKERAAEANLATMGIARELRREEETQSYATEAVDVIKLHYYGLDKVRQDLRKRLDLEANTMYTSS